MSQLQVITTISNPARYESRYRLYRDFCVRMKSCGASLYTIELAAEDQEFSVTESTNPFHFQLRSSHELWYKENLVNIAIGRLPSDWQYVAWVDADVSFARPDWVDETIRMLQQHAFVQMFSHVVDLGPRFEPLRLDEGFAFRYARDRDQRLPGQGKVDPVTKSEIGQPGYAWAARRDELTSVGGLIDWSIMGSNDYYMALALIGQVEPASTGMPDSNYAAMLLQWQHKCEQHVHRDIGYVGTTLLHYWHGNRKHRGYETRWRILADHQFDPAIDLRKDTVGLLNLTDANPGLRDDIRSYFRARREDDVDT